MWTTNEFLPIFKRTTRLDRIQKLRGCCQGKEAVGRSISDRSGNISSGSQPEGEDKDIHVQRNQFQHERKRIFIKAVCLPFSICWCLRCARCMAGAWNCSTKWSSYFEIENKLAERERTNLPSPGIRVMRITQWNIWFVMKWRSRIRNERSESSRKNCGAKEKEFRKNHGKGIFIVPLTHPHAAQPNSIRNIY